MKLTFFADRNECFRRGINTTTNYIQLDIDPAILTEQDRGLIVDRITNVDHVSALCAIPSSTSVSEALTAISPWHGVTRPWGTFMVTSGGYFRCTGSVGVPGITLEALLAAINEDEINLERQCKFLIKVGKLLTKELYDQHVQEHIEKNNL